MALMTLKQAQEEFLRRDRIFEAELQRRGLHAAVTEFGRTNARQNELYAQGRTKPGGKIVTNARAGQSPHNRKLAKDRVPVVNGKRTYKVPRSWWIEFGEAAAFARLVWGGSWGWDSPHVELPNWKLFMKR